MLTPYKLYKPVPPGVSFPELRDSLAVEGGKLLVSVLRDMIAGTVSLNII